MSLRSLLFVLPLFAVCPVNAESATDLLARAGVRGGLVVQVGCGDGRLTAALHAGPSYVVHGLDTDPQAVARARAFIRSQGLYGPVSVDSFDGHHLPYVDGLVNLVLATDPGELKRDEVLRVLAPRGVALLGSEKIVKEVPPSHGEWTHYLYDASGIGVGRDTAVSRPRSMQWKAGPEYSRSHENMSSVSAVVSAGGRVFAILDEGPAASIYLPPRWSLSARDAYSGVLLWRLPLAEWHATLFPLKSGPLQLCRRLVATESRVYATLGLDAPVSELDAVTGEVLRTFPETAHAEELLLHDGKLIAVVNAQSTSKPYRGAVPQSRPGFAVEEKALNLEGERSLVLIDLASGKKQWQTESAPLIPLTAAAEGARVYVMNGALLTCLELAHGKEVWQQEVTGKTPRFATAFSPTLVVHGAMVYVAVGGTLRAYETRQGDRLWEAPCARCGYRAQASLFIVDNLIWDVNVGGEPYRPGSDPAKINREFTGYDLQTGEVRKRLPVSSEQGYGIMHHRCHLPRASGKCLITSYPGIEFFNVETGEVTHDSWIRGACLYGFLPANGLLYAPPHPCACYTQGKLTGFWAVAGKRDRPPVDPRAADRLLRGPASAAVSQAAASADADWPTYRGDGARSGTTPTAVAQSVREQWRADLGEKLTPCVVAEGKLLTASVEEHTVHALDAATGRRLWSYTAGGRVDSPPTIFAGTVLFGCRDGYVYCLTADKGELVWRFRAAPTDERSVVYDQVESVWPVHGSILVHQEVAWCCAGRSSFLDGGLFVYRLNPRTGEVLSMTNVDSLGADEQQPPITSTMFERLDMEGAKNDVLSTDGQHVFLRHWVFDLDGNSVEQSLDHLFSPTGFLDTSWFRRTYWIYGRRYVSGAQGWARVGNVVPTGRIMSVDKDRLYGFGRDTYPGSPGPKHQMYLAGERELFFAADRAAATQAAAAFGDTQRRRGGNAKGTAGRPKGYLWTAPGDLQVRGMVLAGQGPDQRLFVVGLRGDWVTSEAAYEGRDGAVLRVLSPTSGKVLAEQSLTDTPVFDGLAAAGGNLYLVTQQGSVLRLGA